MADSWLEKKFLELRDTTHEVSFTRWEMEPKVIYAQAITTEKIRAQLLGKGMGAVCAHAEPLLDAIINRAQIDTAYSSQLHAWLRGDPGCGTVHLRDNLCEPLRPLPHIQAIGEQFNPTTEWHNTWVPLDTAAHRARYGLDPNDW